MAILALSGRIGSGKDTVGSIIQYLVWKSEVESGQDKTLYWTLQDFLTSNPKSNWKIKKFASKLKQITSLITGCRVEDLESQDFKSKLLSHEWQQYDKQSFGKTYRWLLQTLGTESTRDIIHPNIWINALFCDYEIKRDKFDESLGNNRSILDYPNWIITDCRFPNEADAIRQRDGVLIRINRPLNHVDQDAFDAYKKNLHPSETSLDNYRFDYEVDNSGTIEELIEKVKIILIDCKIINAN